MFLSKARDHIQTNSNDRKNAIISRLKMRGEQYEEKSPVIKGVLKKSLSTKGKSKSQKKVSFHKNENFGDINDEPSLEKRTDLLIGQGKEF